MKINFRVLSVLVVVLISLFASFAQVYNDQGDFLVTVDVQSKKVYNDFIETSFSFKVENQLDSFQSFSLILPEGSGWDIQSPDEKFELAPKESKLITVDFKANSRFDYTPKVQTETEVKYSQEKDYKGQFSFPVILSTTNENLSLTFDIEIDRKQDLPEEYLITIPPKSISPVSPLSFVVEGQHINSYQELELKTYLGGNLLYEEQVSFSPQDTYKIFSVEIPASFTPQAYDVEVVLRKSNLGSNAVLEWKGIQNLNLVEYNKISYTSDKDSSFLKDAYLFSIVNEGNVEDVFSYELDISSFESFFVSTSDEEYLIKQQDGSYLVQVPLEKEESKEFQLYVNYTLIYIILLAFLLGIVYYYLRSNANPLESEVKIYDVKKVSHEGVKLLKVRIGFENAKEEELDSIRVIFRMPSYLNVKDGSFLLSEPNQVLKGKNQYKLVWNFKRFEKNDSRILGFTLINRKGILGDIKLPDLEFEITLNGKKRTYKEAFPVIKG